MSNIKVNLSILLPGGTMLSVEESTRKTKSGDVVMDPNKHDKFELRLNDRGKEAPITVYTRKTKKAKQVIHLCEEAYNYMTSASEIPYAYKGVWRGLKPHERLTWHCNRIAEQLGGTVASIQVLE